MARKFLLLGLAVLLFLGPGALPLNDTFIGGFDVEDSNYWGQSFIKERVRAGHLPLWNPHINSGHPFIANPNTSFFYPYTLAHILLPLPWSFNLDIVLHLFLAGAGMLLFVRALTGSPRAAFCAAVAYTFSGYFIDRTYSGHLTQIHSAALLPWVFFSLERALTRQSFRSYLVVGALLGLQILAGDPQNSYYTSLFLTAYLLLRLLPGLPDLPPAPLFSAVRFLVVPLAAAGLAAAQLLPTAEFAGLSDRAAGSYDFSTFLSFPPSTFLTFLLPRPPSSDLLLNREFSGYIGVLALTLSLTGIFLSRRRRHVLTATVLLLGAATIMLGDHSILYRLYYAVVPGLKLFRIPGRCVLIFSFFLSVLCGLGAEALIEGKLSAKEARKGFVPLLFLLATLLISLHLWNIPPFSLQAASAVAFILIGMTALLLSPSNAGNRKNLVFWALGALLFSDLYIHNHSRIQRLDESSLLAERPYEKLPDHEKMNFRVAFPIDVNRGMGLGYQNIDAKSPLIIGDYFNFLYDMADVRKPELMKGTLLLDYFRSPRRLFSSRILGVKYGIVPLDDGGLRAVTNPEALEKATVIGEARFLEGYGEYLGHMKSPRFDPKKEILLSSGETRPEGGKGAAVDGSAEVVI